MPAIRRIRKHYPRIEISVQVETSGVLARELLASRHDFIIARIPDDLNPRLFESARDRHREGLPDRAPRPSAGRRRASVELESLTGYDWVFQPGGSLLRRTIETIFMSRNVPLPDRILNTTSLLLTLVMVAQSDAIAPVAIDVAKFINGKDGLGRGDRDPADVLRHRRAALQPDHGAQPRALAGREAALRPHLAGDQVARHRRIELPGDEFCRCRLAKYAKQAQSQLVEIIGPTRSMHRLLSFVGQDDTDILGHFLDHYRKLGIGEFHLFIHGDWTQAELAPLTSTDVTIAGVVQTPFDEGIKSSALNDYAARWQDEWIILADADEFLELPYASLEKTIKALRCLGIDELPSFLVQRAAADGSLPSISAGSPIDALFPCSDYRLAERMAVPFPVWKNSTRWCASGRNFACRAAIICLRLAGRLPTSLFVACCIISSGGTGS